MGVFRKGLSSGKGLVWLRGAFGLEPSPSWKVGQEDWAWSLHMRPGHWQGRSQWESRKRGAWVLAPSSVHSSSPASAAAPVGEQIAFSLTHCESLSPAAERQPSPLKHAFLPAPSDPLP